MVGVTRIALAAASIAASSAAHAAPDCRDLMPGREAPSPSRALVPEDLVRLRDIGPVDPLQQSAGLFSISPDGTRAAFQVRRADPVSNDYCLAMVVVDLRPGGGSTVVDRGGEFVRLTFDFRGKAALQTGWALPITPRWSPDGRWIFWLRRDSGGAVQLWRARSDGGGSERVTACLDDIDDFRIAADGRSVIFATRPELRAARTAIDAEARSGFHYDDRFAPNLSNRPFAKPPVPRQVDVLDLASRTTRTATPAEVATLNATDVQEGAWTEITSPTGDQAAIEVPAHTIDPTAGRLVVHRGDRTIACSAAECANASQPWWTRAGTARFLRREGWANSATAIYEWQPGEAHAHRLYATDDFLLGCVPAGDGLICLREASLQPRRLERFEPASGRSEVLFDPNPEYRRLTLGHVERLRSRNSFGLESISDLVLPVGYVAGKRYPLIVVQYSTRGFLRGGTGDDYPIQAFANRGFAVLSVQRPRAVGLLSTTDFVEADRINLKDFADRRSTLESVEIAVRAAIDRGIADPARIGITGLSDGGSTAGFALLHSKLFSAFAMSSCCYDSNQAMRVGPAAAREFQAEGYPRLTDDSQAAMDFWNRISFTPHARQIRAPILLQLPDDEYLGSLQSVTALREFHRPVELYVFPDEHHVKWQPAHRLAIYKRSIDWFDYWLNGIRAPDRKDEIDDWDRLRREMPPEAGTSRP